MVAKVVTNDRLAWLGLAVALGMTLAAVQRDSVVKITSDAFHFGQRYGVDGELLASDDSKDGSPAVRILRVEQKRVVEDVRLAYPKNERVTGVDASAGRVAVKLDRAQEIAIYERGKTWTKTDTIKLKGTCRLTGSESYVELSNKVLVVPGADVICVFEKGASWSHVATLPLTSRPNMAFTNGERVVQLKPGAGGGKVIVSRKKGNAWGVEREISLGDGRHLITAAMSNRWVAVSTRSVQWTDHAVQIYDLASAKLVATLPLQDSADRLAISDTRLVVSDQRQHQVFAFDKAWKAAGSLPHTDNDHVSVANLLWIGRSGVLEGYTLD